MGLSLFPVANINNWQEIKTAPELFPSNTTPNLCRLQPHHPVSYTVLIYSLCSNHLKQDAMFIAVFFVGRQSKKSLSNKNSKLIYLVKFLTQFKMLKML